MSSITLPLGQSRYDLEWGVEFWQTIHAELAKGPCTILDVGSGRRPTIPPEDRPAGGHYIGLDVSPSELRTAPPGSYDETVVADAGQLVDGLIGRCDLIVAWQVFEHVADLTQAAQLFHRYATADGVLVACLSGRNAAYAVANRLVPSWIGSRLVARLMRRPVDTVFPAFYDRCDDTGLRDAFESWEDLEVIPLWRGADYFERVPPVRRAYIAYEDWAIHSGRRNLATHYTIIARRGGPAGAPTS